MKQGEMVLVHLTNVQIKEFKGNNTTPVPAIIVSFWENEYPDHPIDKTGINVRVFTDSGESVPWLTSLPMKYDGIDKDFHYPIASYELLEK